MRFFTFTKIFLLTVMISSAAAQNWQSQIVYEGAGGKLVYVRDAEGNAIPDFSYAGYKNGEEPIPEVPVVKTISPVSGDNTQHIQDALFEVALMPPDSNGIRGALLLTAGEYEVSGTIKIEFSGVVLRGVGDGDDPATNTIIKAVGNSPSHRTVIVAGGGNNNKWSGAIAGSYRNVVSDTVLVGERVLELDDTSPYSVGDNIIIEHPCTAAWLAAIDSGGTYWDSTGADPGVDLPWSVGEQPILYNRYIKSIDGNKITIDAPVYNHLIRNLAQVRVYKYSRYNLITQIGIENLRVDIQTSGSTSENHAWNAIDLIQIEDAWVRNCTMLHFGLSGVRTATATRITVENCKALDPHSIVEGGKRYNFQVYQASQLILFKECHASNGRHHYISNGTSTTSGIVFLDCTSSGAYTSSEGHRRWSQGLLYDNLKELDGPRPGYNPRLLGLYNRGFYGTSHGWSAVHSVAWNCDVNNGDLIVQKPPTAQNYAIGCFGANITGHRPPAPFPEPDGYIEGSNMPGLTPRSLYLAQLQERLGVVDIQQKKTINVPRAIELLNNYPNPFNPATQIQYSLNLRSRVELTIYSLLGQKIKTLVREEQLPGRYSVTWYGIDGKGRPCGSGVYILRLKANGLSLSRKMVLAR
ncbi:MAG: hypothetical protein Kow0037_15830 [Calditrichia bacterium]